MARSLWELRAFYLAYVYCQLSSYSSVLIAQLSCTSEQQRQVLELFRSSTHATHFAIYLYASANSCLWFLLFAQSWPVSESFTRYVLLSDCSVGCLIAVGTRHLSWYLRCWIGSGCAIGTSCSLGCGRSTFGHSNLKNIQVMNCHHPRVTGLRAHRFRSLLIFAISSQRVSDFDIF